MKFAAELSLAEKAATQAGVLLAAAGGSFSAILSEQGKDIKLDADRRAEEIILKTLEPSQLPLLTEESGERGALGLNKHFWVVDPLDGTFNYHRGIGLCCVSIALWLNDAPLLGVVNDFNKGELFRGLVGVKAELNGTAIKVSGIENPGKAVLATGFPVYRDFSDDSLKRFVGEVQRFKKIRLLGSAAISAAYVACGRVDAYAEDDIMLWDVAGGAALAAAAGGWVDVRPSQGKKWATITRLSSSPRLWED